MTREDPAERAERITRELREATAEAAGVLKDLQAVIRSARAQVDEYAAKEVSDVMNAHLQRTQQLADEWHAEMKADGQRALDRFMTTQQELIDKLAKGFEMRIDDPNRPGDEHSETFTLTGMLVPRP